MKIADVMTRNVTFVSKDATVDEVAGLMLGKQISAVPVIDDERRLLGIVSEADLLRRAEIGTQRRWSLWQRLVADRERTARDYLKTYGRRVEDIMTRAVVTVSEEASLPEVVELMERHKVKRVPVTRYGKLAGIISRADILRMLMKSPGRTQRASHPRSDREIHERLTAHVRSQPWRPAWGHALVQDGVVTLYGRELSHPVRRAFAVAAENTAGVKAVRDLVYRGLYSASSR